MHDDERFFLARTVWQNSSRAIIVDSSLLAQRKNGRLARAPSILTPANFLVTIGVGASGPVAQLGEHMVCNHGVGSSILPRSTN